MSTSFSRVNTYPAQPAEVFAMLTDATFHEEVCVEQAANHYQVEVAADDALPMITIRQQQSVEGAPDIVRKLVSGGVDVVQIERWVSPTQADLNITIPGKPGALVGTIELRPADDGGTEEVFAAEVTAKVPLIGGKVEKMIASVLGSGLKRRARVGNRRLGE